MSILGNPLTLGGGGAARKYLVKDGVAVNGNLVALGIKSSSSSAFQALAPSISYGSGDVTLGFTATGNPSGAGIIYIDSSIDLSNYTTLFARGTFRFYSAGSFSSLNLSVNAWTSIGNYQNENRLFQDSVLGSNHDNILQISQLGTLEFDVSTYTSVALIGFNFGRTYGTNAGYANVALTDLWLE